MKKRLNYVLMALITVIGLAGCATLNVRFDSAREWIEGKPFPVQITISKTDKISNVLLHYCFNGTAEKTVSMNQNGSYFTYTIQGGEVVAGVLHYHISYRYKDKGRSINASPVSILSFEQARQKYTQELRSRISFSPPAQVPINRDARLLVQVKSPKPGTRVLFYHKTPDQSSFRETELRNENGRFNAVVSKDELQAGYNTYYFLVTEEHEDVGKLEVFVHDRTSANPFQFDILTLEKLKEVIKAELYASISHQVPRNVYVTRDLELKLAVSYASDTFIRDFSKNALSAEIFYKSPTSNFKKGLMSGARDQFSYIVPSMELEAGYNAYYFKVTDEIEDIGSVTVEYPASGSLFFYDILSVEEIRTIKTNALYQRVSHTPVTTADGITTLYIDLTVKNAGAHTAATLYFKKPKTINYKSANMTREGNTFRGAISIDDQQNGYTRYYFMVTEADEDVGTVSAVFPENGRSRPIQYTVLDKNVIKARLQSELLARLTHRPVTSVAEGEDLKLTINVANMKSGTLVYFYHRKPGESSYRQTQLSGKGPQFTMVVPKQDIRAGYSQYYFEVKEPHNYFGYIGATVASASAPYEFEIRTLKEVILDGIDFTPLSDVEYATPVEAKITLNNIPPGTRIYFKYRLAGDTLDYLSVEMKREEAVYSTILSPAVLQAGKRIDYFISISVDQDEFTYPDESIIPLYFYVKKQLVEEKSGDETVFGTTGRLESNMLEGRIYQLEVGTKTLPQSMHKDYESLIVLYARKLDIAPRNFTEGFPGLENVFEWFGIQYRGMITIREAGLYNFRLLSDDGSKLFVDSNLVIDNDGTHAPKSKTGGIYLSPGTYPIRVDYFQGPKVQIALQLFVTLPGEEEKLFDLKDFE
jgi:hypothetical protein